MLMNKKYDYDLVVIGAGIAGMVSAVSATGIGKKVAVIEKAKVGGNCTNLTCIPSKTLIRSGHLGKDIARMSEFGLGSEPEFKLNTDGVIPHIRSVVQRAYEKDLPESFQAIGVDIEQGLAQFQDNHHIRVGHKTIRAHKFIVACGTVPMIPPIPGLDEVDFLTSENIYELNRLPRSLIILGGGVDGLEYASAFNGLNVETTVVERSKEPLAMADREPVNHLIAALERGGVRILKAATASRVWKENNLVKVAIQREGSETEEISAERILVTLGRRPDLDGLGLENAGVQYNAKGIIADSALRTTSENIYACGDVVGPFQLANTAEYQAIIAATNAFSPVKRRVDYSNNVYVIFTDPTLAYIGVTEAQAHREYGKRLKVYRFTYENMRRAMVDNAEEGMAKFLCDGRGRLVGAHILGEAAAEVIHEAQLIKALKKPLHRFNFITHAYPTYAQALVGRASQLAFLERMEKSLAVRFGLWIAPGFSNRLSLARERLAETHDHESETKGPRVDLAIHDPLEGGAGQRIKVERVGDITCVINLPKELTGPDEAAILAACSGGVAARTRRIILNFADLEKINGVGATMLVKLCARAAKDGRAIEGMGVNKDLRKILKVTQLDQVIKIDRDDSHDNGARSGYGRGEKLSTVDSKGWAKPVNFLIAPKAPQNARNINIQGRALIGPVNGFGRLIQKIYTLHLQGFDIGPEELILALKENFPAFQPPFNTFYPSEGGIKPGEITLIESMTPGGPVATGVIILYADDSSFTFMTPEGHPEAGFVSFSGIRGPNGTNAQIVGVTRANDPLYEIAFHLAGSKIQKTIWFHVLTSLALHFGRPANISYQEESIDGSLQWGQAGNIWKNAQIHTLMREPKRLISRLRRGVSGR
jgi:pyruvate/2-oxoglutarate dehydrogenase complex dihydrolipoamide dehydrogenase (E3) component/anti-anti-sigma regulatory factor